MEADADLHSEAGDSCSSVSSSSSGLGVSEDFLQSIIADVKSVAWYVLGLVVVFVVDVFVGQKVR